LTVAERRVSVTAHGIGASDRGSGGGIEGDVSEAVG